MPAVANRDPAEVPVRLSGVSMDGDALKRARDAGVDRVVFGLPSEANDNPTPCSEASHEVGRLGTGG